MRWFSWFEAAQHHMGDMHVLKMILNYHSGQQPGTEEKDLVEPSIIAEKGMDAQEELRVLRQQQGTLTLAPRLVSNQLVWNVELLLAIVQSTWKRFADRARPTTPQQVLHLHVHEAGHGWADELVDILSDSFYGAATIKRLRLIQACLVLIEGVVWSCSAALCLCLSMCFVWLFGVVICGPDCLGHIIWDPC